MSLFGWFQYRRQLLEEIDRLRELLVALEEEKGERVLAARWGVENGRFRLVVTAPRAMSEMQIAQWIAANIDLVSHTARALAEGSSPPPPSPPPTERDATL